MRLPTFRSGGRLAALTERLGGLRLTGDYPPGALGGGVNLDSDGHPALSQRRPPKELESFASPQTVLYHDALAVIAGGRVYLDGEAVGSVSPGQKLTAAVSDKIYIFPDKVCLDLRARSLSPMEKTVTVTGAVFDDRSVTAEIAWPFAPGDGVRISGCSDSRNDQTLIVRAAEGGRLTFDPNVFEPSSEAGAVTLGKYIPDLEAVCESGNRLWGCAGDTIYGSKLGDPTNFFVFDGLSTDSYSLKTGGGGSFTACARYSSHIVFFKEESACKLYGTRPANFQLMTSRMPGVRRGCGGSLVTENEEMYYLGPEGVYAYSGGVPRLISFELGQLRADHACAAARGGRYYLSLGEGEEGRTLIFDINRELWLPWGGEDIRAMAEGGGRLFMLCRDGRLLAEGEGDGAELWQAELRPLKSRGRYESTVSLIINARPEEGAWLAVDMDENGVWRELMIFDGEARGIRPVPLPPNRSGELRLRLRGKGRCPVYSIERIFREGGERR